VSTHWLYVTIAWGIAAAVFGTLTLTALTRYRTAKRQLARLETRR
jgi:heme exporter protein CcmD